MAPSPRPTNADVITKIESVIETIVDNLLREETLSISLKQKKRIPASHSPDIPETSFNLTDLSFPGRNGEEARRFTILLRILELVHEALTSNTIISKRNIYYKSPSLFKSQAVVDRYIDILAYTFGVQRSALNVTAAAKGLVVGVFTLVSKDGGRVTKGFDDLPHLLDESSLFRAVDMIGISWILVVEKESTFRTLAASKLHLNSRAGEGIILTVSHILLPSSTSFDTNHQLISAAKIQAKGYPDISTRTFLHLLSTSALAPPIYALTDFDPDGIAIMSTYARGSVTLAHENAVNVPSIQWLGLKSFDVVENTNDDAHDNAGNDGKGLLRMSGRDRKKATKMLENSPGLVEEGGNAIWRREMQVMLMLNIKAEMEILADREGGIARWSDHKLMQERSYLQG